MNQNIEANKQLVRDHYEQLVNQKNVAAAVGTHETDTGSPEVQVGILTRRIEELTDHLKKNKKDKHSRRGLLQMVANRQTHMSYLLKKNPKRHASLVKKLNLKKK